MCACLDGFVDLWPDCKCIKRQRKHCNLLLNPARLCHQMVRANGRACCPYSATPTLVPCMRVCVAGVLAFVLISHTHNAHTLARTRRLIVLGAVSELCF